MPSTNNLLTLTAILALTTLPSTVVATEKQRNLRANKRLRRGQINHINEVSKTTTTKKEEEGGGLEEDVLFYTNMARNLQDMSIPMPAPTLPPVVATNLPATAVPTAGSSDDGGTGATLPPDAGEPVVTLPPVAPTLPTLPPVAPTLPTLPPVGGVVTPPPVPVGAVVCAQGETCAVEDDVCSDGTTEECCGETFESFVCTCTGAEGTLTYDCAATNACLDKVCGTDPPASGPTPTPPPVPDTGGFKCPAAAQVGCTATDPSNPVDECDVVGEPCSADEGWAGEFCCLDACPRNYCTAKQAISAAGDAVIMLPMPTDWKSMLPELEKNDP